MQQQGTEQTEIHIREYWRILQRRWRIIAITVFVVFITASAVMFTQPALYNGTATVLVEERKSTLALEELSLGGGAIPVETEMEIIKSRTIAEAVVEALGLDVVPDTYNPEKRLFLTGYTSQNFPPNVYPEFSITLQEDNTYVVHGPKGKRIGVGHNGKLFQTDSVSFTATLTGYKPGEMVHFTKLPFQGAVAQLQNNLVVQQIGKKTNIIDISVKLADPYLARDTANKITEVYLAQNIAHKSQEASQMLDFIEQQLETIRRNLEAGEQELDEIKTTKGIFILSETAQKLISQISQLEVNRASLDLQLQRFEQLKKGLESAGDDEQAYILGQVSVPDPIISQLIGELASKLVQIRGLRQDLTDNNPQISVLMAQIDELKTKIRMAVENAKTSLARQLEAVDKILMSYEGHLKTLPRSERELAAVTRKSQVNAELYTFLLKKHEEARISKAGIVGNARVIDPALVSMIPVSPRIKRNLAIFLLAGLFLGITVALFVEYLDDSIKGVEEVEQRFGLSSFGIIPMAGTAGEDGLSIATLDPLDPFQEAFRSLRTNIYFAASESPIQSIFCTSAAPGAGKTTINANLAISLSQNGHKVLLVDCDLRRPQVHRHFGLKVEPGLTNSLLSSDGWESIVRNLEAVPGLTVLTAGTIPPNPADLLASERFKNFVTEIRKKFDFIVFDIPPSLAFSDSSILAPYADAVFFVVEAGRSRLPLVRRALGSLANVKANVRGVILNKIDTNSDSSGYYYQYAYREYYESREPTKVKRLRDWLGL
jgi:tyrosine-protein kinase Etk/Wzc